ncbi:MAG: hypothetical protein EA343_06855 [Nodularia sp. (in: Bacteria)]|nr:MAG: hypothetical protein EA343_06855 [Nodularia sp. (in: cyanobacteria)]
MSTINIQDIKVAGSDLFFDEETYLNELSHDEIGAAKGGITPTVAGTIALSSAFVLSYNLSKIGTELKNKFF